MKKFLTLALIGAVALGISSVVYANVCAFDAVPAATLLFPFVQYDYVNDGAGATTLFSITNVSSEAQVVHVTLWTDYSVAILDFNILLTGYDVQTINIRDILKYGVIPAPYNSSNGYGDPGYGHQGGQPNSDGPVSGTNTLNGDWVEGLLAPPEAIVNTLTCVIDGNHGHPSEYTEPLPGWVINNLRDWLMISQTGDRYYDTCSSDPTSINGTWWLDGDFNANRPTWMYITADVVTQCNLTMPDDPFFQYFEYISDGTADGMSDGGANVLMGDVIYLDPINNFSETLNAVHLEADEDLGLVASALWDLQTGQQTTYPISFYTRYANHDPANGTTPWAYREPLGTAWAFRYMTDPSNNAETYIRAWKGGSWYRHIVDLQANSYDVFTISELTALNCLAYTYYAWDEEENVTSGTDNPWSIPGVGAEVPNLLPLETQEVNVTEFTLPWIDSPLNTVGYGWMLFVWPASNFDGLVNAAPNPDFYQTYMSVKYKAFGQYSAAHDGVLMGNYNCFSQQVLPNLGIDFDYVAAPDGYVISANTP